MKQKVIKVLVLFLGVFLVTLLRADEQDVCYNAHRDTVSFDHQDALFEMSSLPILFRGDLSPANAAYSITRSGVYQLTSAKTASGVPNISITANNVTLDLGGNTLTGGTNGIEITGNNVTVKNGTVSGVSQSGVFVQGSGCRIENCDVVSSPTGITLQNSNQCVIENCRVRNATQAGVSLISSYTNYVHCCSAVGVQSVSDAYGFVAANGGNNIFDDCSARDIKTTANFVLDTVGWNGSTVGGFIFKGEQNSQFLTCEGQSITALAGYTNQAHGVGALLGATLPGADVLLPVTQSPFAVGSPYSVAWLVSGDTKYLASGGSGANEEVQIYRFDEATSSLFSVTKSLFAEDTVNSVAWLVSGDTKYLASGGAGTNEIKIYRFDEATSSLFSVTESPLADGTVRSVAWLISGDTKYLASGGQGTNEVQIYRFDEATSSLFSVTKSPFSDNEVKSVAWLVSGDKKYLASGTLTGNEVRIFRFDEATSSLFSVAQSPYAEGSVNSVAWLVSGDTKYLASGGQPTADTGNQVSIFRFDEATSSLLSITHSPYAEGLVGSVAWLVSGDRKYLASGGIGTNEVKMYLFDEATSSLLSVTESPYADGQILSIAWLASGDRKYLASGGVGTNEVKIYEFDGVTQQSPQNCLLTNNKLSSVHSSRKNLAIVGDVANGIGLSSTTTSQYVASNVCYDCDISFTGVPTQFIDSQANARGVDNIDTTLTTPDTVSLIVEQVSTIESKVDILYQDSSTVESKLDYLMACDYEALPAPTTLSTAYGAYCLSADMAGDLAITGSGITLCLNGHTISGGTNGILVSGDEVVIKNGTVKSATASGIKITGDKCTLQDIVAVSNVTGFEFNGADNSTVSSCRAIDNTREGFLLTNAQKNNFEQCEALTTSGAGLVAGIKTTGGMGNNFVDCTVNGVTSSAGEAYGLLASNEQKTSIASCSVNDVSGANYTAGVALIGDYLGTPTVNDFTYAESRNSRFPEWLNTPVGSYLAISNESAPLNARIFQFPPTDGLTSVTTTQNMAASCRQATWLSWHNKQYLAMVGDNDAGDDIFVYEFNLASNTLTTVTSYNYSATAGVFGCDWIVSGALAYLAYVVYPNFASGEELGVLRFDGSTLTKVSSLDYIATGLLSVKHHLYSGKIRLAVTQHPPTGRPDLIIHSFNEPQGSEALTTSTLGLVSYDLSGDEYIEKSAWFDFDGQTYLAFGIVGAVSTSNVRVLQYTENPTPTLTAFASFNYGGVVQDVDAVVTGTTVYLAIGGNIAGQKTKILTFDPYAASADRIKSYYNCSADANQSNGVSWNRCPALDNKLFLAVSKAAANPRVYGFTLTNQSQLNLVSDCIVADVKSISNGAGFLADNVINSVSDNRAYNCQNGFVEGVRTQRPGASFDTSNWPLPG